MHQGEGLQWYAIRHADTQATVHHLKSCKSRAIQSPTTPAPTARSTRLEAQSAHPASLHTKCREHNTRWLRYFDIACVLSLFFGLRHNGPAVCNTLGTIPSHHMPSEDDEPLTQEPYVLGLYWLLADDDINCSRGPLAYIMTWSRP